MSGVESFNNTVNAINKHSGPIATDAVMVTFISEIAGSLAVIADAMAEKKDGEDNERFD